MTNQKTYFFDFHTRPKVLVAPLNWGLGHATRCMPIIQGLLERNMEVIIASDGRALALLKQEYPQLTHIELPAYNITYSDSTLGLVPTMLYQIPKILRAIAAEKKQIDKLVTSLKINAIVSDNRYGCYHTSLPSIILGHQLFLKMPSSLQWLEPIVARTQMRFIRPFNQCWIPDFPNLEDSLSGDLAHKQPLEGNRFRFIGSLSRMKKQLPPMKSPQNAVQQFLKKNYDIVAVLSGPEPQRTLFEEMLQQQLLQLPSNISRPPLQCLIVRGITEQQNVQSLTPNVDIINFLTAENLNRVLLTADIAVSRSGYSTLMDLAALGKRKAILVPTPGQTEQVYLAQYFHAKKIFYSSLQSELNLNQALEEVKYCKGLRTPKRNLLEGAIEDLLKAILTIGG